jgi:hypothetical protein
MLEWYDSLVAYLCRCYVWTLVRCLVVPVACLDCTGATDAAVLPVFDLSFICVYLLPLVYHVRPLVVL